MKARVFSAYIKDVDKKWLPLFRCSQICPQLMSFHADLALLFGAKNYHSTRSVENTPARAAVGFMRLGSLLQAIFLLLPVGDSVFMFVLHLILR